MFLEHCAPAERQTQEDKATAINISPRRGEKAIIAFGLTYKMHSNVFIWRLTYFSKCLSSAFDRFSTRNYIVTRRRVAPTNVRSVTVAAHEIPILIDCFKFLSNIETQTFLVMTLTAGRNRYIRFQPTHARRFCDVDMAGGAFGNMLLASMSKLQRVTIRSVVSSKRFVGEFVATATVVTHRLLRMPMTVETRIVAQRDCFEETDIRDESIRPFTTGRNWGFASWGMTDLTVVKVFCFVILWITKACTDEQPLSDLAVENLRDHVLVFVVWKLNDKLALTGRIAKTETRIVTWGNPGVTYGTDWGFGAFEKLRTMATYTRVVSGIVRNVRKAAYLFPIAGRRVMAGIACALVFLRCM